MVFFQWMAPFGVDELLPIGGKIGEGGNTSGDVVVESGAVESGSVDSGVAETAVRKANASLASQLLSVDSDSEEDSVMRIPVRRGCSESPHSRETASYEPSADRSAALNRGLASAESASASPDRGLSLLGSDSRDMSAVSASWPSEPEVPPEVQAEVAPPKPRRQWKLRQLDPETPPPRAAPHNLQQQ